MNVYPVEISPVNVNNVVDNIQVIEGVEYTDTDVNKENREYISLNHLYYTYLYIN